MIQFSSVVVSTKRNLAARRAVASLFFTTALTGVFAAGHAMAQTAAPSSNPLAEVVVTAERRAVNLQTTPIAMSAISGADLDKKSVRNLSDLQFAAPALSITDNGLTQNVNIRGIGSTVISPAISGGVAMIRDGLFQPEAIQQGDGFYDINDIEVLRGPQGTFVGQNSTGGAILITSKNPTLGEVSGSVMGQVGNYNDKKVTAAVNLPINSTMAARVALNYEGRDSFFTNIGGQVIPASPSSTVSQPGALDSKQIRVGFLWRPTDAFSMLIKNEYAFIDNGGFTGKPLPHSQFSAFSPSQPYLLNYDLRELETEASDRLGVEMKYQFANGFQFRSMSGYQYMDIHNIEDRDRSSANGTTRFHEVGPNNHYWSQEFNLASPTDKRFSWIVGYSYFWRKTPVYLIDTTSSAPFSVANPLRVDVGFASELQSQGAFGQASYKLTDTLDIVLGGRESFDTQIGSGRVIVGGNVIPQTGNYKVSTPTGKLALNWTPIAGQFFYAFAARGYKPGGVNDINSNFAAEHVTDYELGWKGTLFDGHLRTQLGGYYMKYDSLQFTVISPVTGRGSIQNIAQATVKGFEASAQARFGQLSLDGSAAYVNSEVQGITLVQSNLLPDGGSGSLGIGCSATITTNCFNYNPFLRSISGAQNTYSPEWTFNLGAQYEISVPGGTLTPRVDYAYVGEQWATIFQGSGNTDSSQIPSHGLWGAQLAYQSGLWTLEAYGKNLSNTVYIGGKGDNSLFYGAPRQFGVRASRTF